MTTLAELRQDVLEMLGEDGFSVIRHESIDRWLNEALDVAVERALNLQAESTTETVAGQDSYVLPDNLLMVNSVFLGNHQLPEVSIGEYRRRQNQGAASNGQPVYAYWQGALYIHPAPRQSGDVIRIYYLRAPEPMSDHNDVPDLQASLGHMLKAYALEKAYLRLRDLQMAQYWLMKWEQSLRHLRLRYGPKFHDYWDTMEVVR